MFHNSVFRTPFETHFGPGVVDRVGASARRYGRRTLLISGAHSARASGVMERVRVSLEASGVTVILFDNVRHEPTVAIVEKALAVARTAQCDVLIGLGGGSPIDVAKCAAGMFYSEHSVTEHFAEDVDLPERVLPWIAVPTTAGAGAEATPNAVLTDERSAIKKSVRSWDWLAKAAIVDPELTLSCPSSITAYSGMDAFAQAVESYTSRWATPLTESISLEAASQVARGLLPAFKNGHDLKARSSVAWGAMMSGIALANARLGAVHGFAHSVGTLCDLPHGMVCAILLPAVIEYNLSAAEQKYARLARELGASRFDSPAPTAARALLEFVRELNTSLGIAAKLGEVGLQSGMIDEIVAQTLPSGSLAANPKDVPKEDLEAILRGQLV